MKQMNLKAALRYDLRASVRGVSGFLAVMALVVILNMVINLVLGGRGSFNGLEISNVIFLFVVGICSVREDIRLFLQNGCGRRTVFLSQLVIAFVSALLLAVFGWVFIKIFQLLTPLVAPRMEVASMLELIIPHMGGGSIAAVLASIGFGFLLYVPAYLLGMMISLIYYRLNKLGKVAVSILIPGVLFIGLPFGITGNRWLSNAVDMAITSFLNTFQTPFSQMAVVTFIGALLFGAISFLLIRRAPVK